MPNKHNWQSVDIVSYVLENYYNKEKNKMVLNIFHKLILPITYL